MSAPDDAHEREAEQVARGILAEDFAPPSQGPADASGSDGTPRIDRWSHGAAAQPTTAAGISAPAAPAALGAGSPLPAASRALFEPRFGRELSRVRVHTGAGAQRAAAHLSARAFTVGHHIGFAEGEYRPESADGKALLAHELTHVLQQTGAGTPPSLLAATPWRSALPRSAGVQRQPCQQDPARLGLDGPEHAALEVHYTSVINPSAMYECELPGSSARGNTGYADIADPTSREIYDFKTYASAAHASTAPQLARYVASANANCPPADWGLGVSYRDPATGAPEVVIPYGTSQELVARQYLGGSYPENWPGVVVYRVRNRGSRRRSPQPSPQQVPLFPLLLLLLLIIIILLAPEAAPALVPVLAAATALGVIALRPGRAEAATREEELSPVEQELSELIEENRDLLERLTADPGTPLSPEELRRLLLLGRDVLERLVPTSPEDPRAAELRAVIEEGVPLAQSQARAEQSAASQNGPPPEAASSGGNALGETAAPPAAASELSTGGTETGALSTFATTSSIPANAQERSFHGWILQGIDRTTRARVLPYVVRWRITPAGEEPFVVSVRTRVIASHAGVAELEFAETWWVEARWFGIREGSRVTYRFGAA